jgi:tripartite-type tricarboxylate transporter receptor subunit TctC
LHIVPFSTTPAGITAVLAGEVVAMIDGYPSFEGMMRSGDVRLIATFASERMANNRSIPTASEQIPDLAGTGWFAIFAPKGTPDQILEKFRKSVVEAISNEEVSRRLVSLSIFPEAMGADDLGKFLKKEQGYWSDAVKTAGAKSQ